MPFSLNAVVATKGCREMSPPPLLFASSLGSGWPSYALCRLPTEYTLHRIPTVSCTAVVQSPVEAGTTYAMHFLSNRDEMAGKRHTKRNGMWP